MYMEEKPFGTQLATYRKRAKLSADALGKQVNCTRQAIQNYENGSRDPRRKGDWKMVEAMATALHLSETEREAFRAAPEGPHGNAARAAPLANDDMHADDSALDQEGSRDSEPDDSADHGTPEPHATIALAGKGRWKERVLVLRYREHVLPFGLPGLIGLGLAVLLSIAVGIGYAVRLIEAPRHATPATLTVQGYMELHHCGTRPRQIGGDFYMPSRGDPQCNSIQWIPVVPASTTQCAFYAMRPTDTVAGHQYRGTANVVYDMNLHGHFKANISVPATPYHAWYYLATTDPRGITFGVGDNAGHGQGVIGLGPIKAVCS